MFELAFATSQKSPELTPDDSLVADVLQGRNVRVIPAIWDDPAVDWSRFDAVVIRATWDYHLQPDRYAEWLGLFSTTSNRLWNPPSAVRQNMHKSYLAALAQSGVCGFAARANPFRFGTKFTDDESGMLSYPLRDYIPSTGRWATRDHMEEAGGINIYSFCFNATPNWADDLGGQPFSLTGQSYSDGTTPVYRDGPLPNPVLPPSFSLPPSSPTGPRPPSPPPPPRPGFNPTPNLPPNNPTMHATPAETKGQGAAGVFSMCADIFLTGANRLAYESGIRKCEEKLALRSAGPKCCVVILCHHCGCVTGWNRITLGHSYLAEQPCSRARQDLANGNVLIPSCPKGDRMDPRFQDMF